MKPDICFTRTCQRRISPFASRGSYANRKNCFADDDGLRPWFYGLLFVDDVVQGRAAGLVVSAAEVDSDVT